MYNLLCGSLHRGGSYAFHVLVWFIVCNGLTQLKAFDSTTFDALRLGDQITSDMLDEIRAFQAILNQPISLGVLVKGGSGPPGARGPPGDTGGRGTNGDPGPAGETGSTGLEGRFGKPGTPGPPGEPGIPGYGRIYYDKRSDPMSYGNERTSSYGNYANEHRSDVTKDQPISEETKVLCEGERVRISCGQNEMINVTSAFWGRDDFITCTQYVPRNHSIRQYSLDYDHVQMRVKDVCNSRPICEFYATRLFLDDVTHPQVHKYLRVVYECIPTTYDQEEDIYQKILQRR